MYILSKFINHCQLAVLVEYHNLMAFSICNVKKFTSFSVFRHLIRAFSSGSSDTSETKLYEYRQYSIKPDSIGKFNQISKDKFHLRLKHSKLIGYFTVELGGLNQALHVWEYDSYEHRRKVRENLSKDSEWVSQFVQPVFPLFTQQTNAILRRVPGWGVGLEPKSDSSSVYQMQIRTLKAGTENLVLHKLQECLMYHAPPPHMLALWRGVLGPTPSLYSLHRFPSFDDMEPLIDEDLQKEQIRETYKFLDSHSLGVSKLALQPTSWSPLQ